MAIYRYKGLSELSMGKRAIKQQYIDLASTLKIDCDRCSGLCCVALCFVQAAGFPEDKEAGKPCKNLLPDFRCTIYSQLEQRKMKGCLAYDCFGAGQKVTQACFPNGDWKTTPNQALIRQKEIQRQNFLQIYPAQLLGKGNRLYLMSLH